MAVVTITITDDELGGCMLKAHSDPETPDNDDDCTPAQLAGAMVMHAMQALVNQVESQVEGKGE